MDRVVDAHPDQRGPKREREPVNAAERQQADRDRREHAGRERDQREHHQPQTPEQQHEHRDHADGRERRDPRDVPANARLGPQRETTDAALPQCQFVPVLGCGTLELGEALRDHRLQRRLVLRAKRRVHRREQHDRPTLFGHEVAIDHLERARPRGFESRERGWIAQQRILGRELLDERRGRQAQLILQVLGGLGEALGRERVLELRALGREVDAPGKVQRVDGLALILAPARAHPRDLLVLGERRGQSIGGRDRTGGIRVVAVSTVDHQHRRLAQVRLGELAAEFRKPGIVARSEEVGDVRAHLQALGDERPHRGEQQHAEQHGPIAAQAGRSRRLVGRGHACASVLARPSPRCARLMTQEIGPL
jgi:hypothetical protein